MVHYEYTVMAKLSTQSLAELLNWMGKEGWRYMHYIPAEGYVFEREAPTEAVETPTPSSKPTSARRKTSRKPKASSSKSQ